ncbi:MAG: HEAT repeat domain-containing protein, partial [Nocardioidaceae bacterium]
GRPLRLPEDNTPLHRVHGGVNARVAWLLASSRIHAADPALAHRDQFVAALNDLGVLGDQARVSRWESGSQPIPDRIVVAYEQALGIVPGRLSAAVHGLRRTLDPDAPTPEVVVTSPETIHDDLDLLFEQAYDDGDGSHWLALTNYLALHPNNYLRPRTWTELSDRLVRDMTKATGVGFTRRFEALRTLIRHPGAQKHVVRSIGAFVTDPDAQSVIYPLTLLQEVEHPKAQKLVMRLLGTSSGMLQQGAAWVAAAKLARGHFDEEAQRKLEGLSVLMIAAGPKATADVDIFDVAARLPEPARQRVVTAVRESSAFPRLDTLITDGEILPKTVTREVAHQVAMAAQAATPAPYRIDPDMMLERLVREALFHGHQERRHQSGILLTVSPYRSGVAAACAELVGERDGSVAIAAARLLRYLAVEDQRAELLAWAADESRPEIGAAALVALGRLTGEWSAADDAAVHELLAATGDADVRRGCMYALGMSGSDGLSELARHGDDEQRRAAEWWIRLGPAIHESTELVESAHS